MLGLLEALGLGTTLAEIGATLGFMKWKQREGVKDAMLLRKNRPRQLPVIDGLVERHAGGATPTKIHKAIATRIVSTLRFVVNTKAFETLVHAAVNPKSKLRQRIANARVKEVAITL